MVIVDSVGTFRDTNRNDAPLTSPVADADQPPPPSGNAEKKSRKKKKKHQRKQSVESFEDFGGSARGGPQQPEPTFPTFEGADAWGTVFPDPAPVVAPSPVNDPNAAVLPVVGGASMG